MGSRGACSNHGDVRQRSKVMDGESAAVDVRSKLPIGDTGTHRNRSCFGVKFDLLEVLQGYLVDRAVGDAIEGVACPKCFEMRVVADAVQDVLESICLIQILSAI